MYNIDRWRGVVGFEDYYKISNGGQVWSIRSNRLLATPVNSKRGYKEFTIKINGKSKTCTVHREIARAFLGEPNGRHVRHLNGNPLDNRLENLEYGTPLENQNDRRQEHYTGAKLLTDAQVADIRVRNAQGERTEDIARDYGFGYRAIANVLDKKQTEVSRDFLWRCVETGAGISVIAEVLGVTHGAVSTLLKRMGKPMREIRKQIPLNSSISATRLRQLIET